MTGPSRYSPEVRERAVRLVQEHEAEYASQWAAIKSECRERMIVLGARHLRRGAAHYVEYYDVERTHQGHGNRWKRKLEECADTQLAMGPQPSERCQPQAHVGLSAAPQESYLSCEFKDSVVRTAFARSTIRCRSMCPPRGKFRAQMRCCGLTMRSLISAHGRAGHREPSTSAALCATQSLSVDANRISQPAFHRCTTGSRDEAATSLVRDVACAGDWLRGVQWRWHWPGQWELLSALDLRHFKSMRVRYG